MKYNMKHKRYIWIMIYYYLFVKIIKAYERI